MGSFEIDHTEEDLNRDETARATGFIGKGSEISWLHKLGGEVDCDRDPAIASCVSSPGPNSPSNGHGDSCIALSNYYLDDLDLPCVNHLDAYEVPTREAAGRLFNAYLSSVHPSFPIIGVSTFASQFQAFFSQPTLKPGRKWLAILNLIFAIGARFVYLTDSSLHQHGKEHMTYFSRAKVLSLDDQFLQHPDLQQLQVEGLASFYLLVLGHMNRYYILFLPLPSCPSLVVVLPSLLVLFTLTVLYRSWKLIGSAVRGALSLGLHLRNEGPCTSDVSKEIRYRVWWSLYTVEHLLTVMTGRPSCIADNFCTTPLPVPFDESDFQKEEVARLISSPRRGSIQSQLDGFAVPPPGTPGPDASDPDASFVSHGSNKDVGIGSSEYLKGLTPCMSLYFIRLASLTAISKRVMVKLYSPEAALLPSPTIEFTIQSLMLGIDSWLINLPAAYDFTSTQTSQCPASQNEPRLVLL